VVTALAVSFVLFGIAQANIESGLVGYWQLDGDAADFSDIRLDGTINGSVESAPA